MQFHHFFILLLLALPALAQKQILFVTHSAGFRHDSIPVAVTAFRTIGQRTGAFSVTATEDLSFLTAGRLAAFDAVFFFTSGELALSDAQKRDLLAYVRSGKGFGGAHSATDTLYSWAEYGDMIGGYFDGHPWVQEVSIDIEDPDFPGQREFAPSYRIVEEIYQFREFSRDRVRVMQTLDTATVDLRAPGVNRRDNDFALTWRRNYGDGRVFYTALGHFDDTWRDARFQKMLEGALLWLIGDVAAGASPVTANPEIAPGGVRSLAGQEGPHAPGAILALYGAGLTTGATLAAATIPLPRRLAGTRVEFGGRPLPLFYVSPGQVNVQLPSDAVSDAAVDLVVWSATRSVTVPVTMVRVAPAIVAASRTQGTLVVYATGLGLTTPPVPEGAAAPVAPLSSTIERPRILVNASTLVPFFSGLAPTLVGVYQVNATLPAELTSAPLEIELELDGARSNRFTLER